MTSLIFAFATLLSAHADFRMHLFSEPQTLDPQTSASSSGNYLFHNLYRGLYRYDGAKGLVPEVAEACTRRARVIRCQLREMKWSNGEPVTAAQFVESFRRLIDPDRKSPQSETLFTLKNAREIWDGKLAPSELGVRAVDDRSLEFQLGEDDPEFEYRLAGAALSPHPPGGYPKPEEAAKLVTNGPYRIASWKRGSRAKLAPNPGYALGNAKRPAVEVLFLEDDVTALRLFEAGKLDFNRRLPNREIARFRSHPGFHQFPMARFDYVGFAPELSLGVREALVAGVDYQDFLRLFDTRSPAGCPSLPARLLDRVECLKLDANKAREMGAKHKVKLEMHFSQLGGDDIARAAEWFQNQWRTHAGLEVELKPREQTTYLRGLRVKAPQIFRKGVSLDRPTCLAAVEIFLPGNPENFIRLDDAEFNRRVKRLAAAKTDTERKKLCRESVARLVETRRLIPLGEMHFTVLARPEFKDWDLNELNQLDLSRLRGP